jgi:hypothetical protein
VHWQAGDRALPEPAVGVAGETAPWVDPAESPSDDAIVKSGQTLAIGPHGDRDGSWPIRPAYSGLRWGELIALTVDQGEASSTLR